jgi:hypothetical protein
LSVVLVLIICAVVFNGTLSGASLEASLVKLPARRRIGARAYAVFARGNDLGNGLWVYPPWAIGSALLVFAATAAAFASRAATLLAVALAIASTTSILHFLTTSRAAPVMLSIRDAPDEESVLARKLNTFARWHAIRAAFQVLTFLVLIWSLVIAR